MKPEILHEGAQLKNAADKMGAIIQSMTNIENAIMRIHNKTIPIWQGKAAEQNQRNFSRLSQLTGDYLKDAQETKNVLDNAVLHYDKTEDTQKIKVSQLDTKGIF